MKNGRLKTLEIQQHVQKPDKEAGEEIETFADDKSLSDKQDSEEDEKLPDMLNPMGKKVKKR